ncbi:hypothetical protein [Actinocorallia longicatena]|uniref:Uncharacterized protein n=1 Tax=Actinocorallia longicatena TaxID=111803 RepID=A0ABP6QED6_9ACTN
MRKTVAVALVGVLVVAAAQPAAAAPGWKNVKSKAFKRAGGLVSVAAVNRKAIFAIGEKGTPFHWNGKAWTARKGAGSFLAMGIAASGAKKAWAVGFSGATPVAIAWNGRKWRKVRYEGAPKLPIPIPIPVVPIAVDASPDGAAWSIGGLNNRNDGPSVVRRWNGKAFVNATVPLPPSASLTAVSVRNRKDVWLAGTYTANGTQVKPLVMHLTGGSWKNVSPSGDWGVIGQPHNIVQDIVATGPASAWAIRSQNGGGLLRHKGGRWAEAGTPAMIAPYALATDGGSGAWAIPVPGFGGAKARYLHWTGRWTVVSGPSHGANNALIRDIDHVPGTKMTVAVGGVTGKAGKQYPLVEVHR